MRSRDLTAPHHVPEDSFRRQPASRTRGTTHSNARTRSDIRSRSRHMAPTLSMRSWSSLTFAPSQKQKSQVSAVDESVPGQVFRSTRTSPRLEELRQIAPIHEAIAIEVPLA